MTGKENNIQAAFDEIVLRESLAEGYRNHLRQQTMALERSYPWLVRKLFFIMRRIMRVYRHSRVSEAAPWRHPKGDLALDKHEAYDRKSLYIKDERIAVYTSLFGSYDVLREPLLHPENIDYYVLTDQEIPEISAWKPLDAASLIPAYCQGDQTLCNRWCKMHPHLIFKDYKYSVYVDSNIWIFSDLTPLTAGLDSFPVAMFRHKKRDCVYDEIKACLKQKKGTRKTLMAHKKLLLSHGVPKHWGLVEASVIPRRHLDPGCISLMEEWWEAFTQNSRRDQISLIDCLWQKGLKPSDIGTLGDNLHKCDLFFQMHHAGSPKSAIEPKSFHELLECVD